MEKAVGQRIIMLHTPNHSLEETCAGVLPYIEPTYYQADLTYK